MRRPVGKIIRVATAVLFAFGPLSATAAETLSYAGTVSSLDTARGSFVLQDVGPCRGKSQTNIVNRTIVLSPTTTVAVASRGWDGMNKFPGDYEEIAAQPSDLKDGAFVAVECQPMGRGCRALKLTVRTDQPPA